MTIGQEHGPPPHGSTWESHRIWAPALPVFTAVVQHVDECFHDFYRSRKHYVPDAEPDIRLLLKRHAELKFNEYRPEQPQGKQVKRMHDCWEAGRVKVFEKDYLGSLAQERAAYLTYSSSLELASHTELSIEQIIEQMRQDSQHTTTNPKSTQHQMLSAMRREDNEDNELVYDFNQTEENEQGGSAYEEQRHRLADAWGC